MLLELKTKRSINLIFFILQFIIILALISVNKLDYIKDVIFITILFGIYMVAEDKYNVHISNYTRICVMSVALIHNFAGKFLDYYLLSTVFDKFLHVFGIYSVVLLCYSIMSQFMEISFKARLNKFIFIVLIGISLGALFEVAEFTADMVIKPKIPNQVDLNDTDLDIVADIVGALIAAVHISFIGAQPHLPDGK